MTEQERITNGVETVAGELDDVETMIIKVSEMLPKGNCAINLILHLLADRVSVLSSDLHRAIKGEEMVHDTLASLLSVSRRPADVITQ